MLFLSAGHSNQDPGAVAEMVIDKKKVIRKEADIVVELRNIVSFYLMREMVVHECDGAGTVNVPLAQTIRMMKNHAPALEFHCNAASSAQAGGCETLSQPKDLELGRKLCEAISATLGIKNRGAKPEDAGQHHRLAFVQAGGIIVELFFITNPADLAAYDAKKWLLGKAIAQVLMTN